VRADFGGQPAGPRFAVSPMAIRPEQQGHGARSICSPRYPHVSPRRLAAPLSPSTRAPHEGFRGGNGP